jgi:hypothetical protein
MRVMKQISIKSKIAYGIFVDIANIFSSSVRRGKGFPSRDCDIGCFSRFA